MFFKLLLWTRSRASGVDAKYVPSFKSFATLQARFGYSEKEILRACYISQRLRSINLAVTRSFEDNPHDILAVECYMKNRVYGCYINRNSPVTIIVPSATCGLGRFGFYLALCGGFNFISKEILEHDSTERYFNISKDFVHYTPILVQQKYTKSGSQIPVSHFLAERDDPRIPVITSYKSKR